MRHQLFIDADGKVVRRGITFNQALAVAMALPLRTTLDYAGIARKALQIDPLPPGALPIYDRDIDICGILEEETPKYKKTFKHDKFSINSEGKTVFHRFGKLIFPSFEVFNNPTVQIAEVKQRRFPLIDRAVQTARQQLMSTEQDSIFKALDEVVLAPPEEKKESFWCEGCGEPRYKCYCDEDCPHCGRKLLTCIAESDDGWCDKDPNIDRLRSV